MRRRCPTSSSWRTCSATSPAPSCRWSGRARSSSDVTPRCCATRRRRLAAARRSIRRPASAITPTDDQRRLRRPLARRRFLQPVLPRLRARGRGRRTSGRGTVEFPVCYEGPPGIVHGGFLAVFFDCVLQQLNCDLGLAGKTAELSLRFRRPTPLLTPSSCTPSARSTDSRIRLARRAAPRRQGAVRGGDARRGRRSRRAPDRSPRAVDEHADDGEPCAARPGRGASRRSTTSCATTTG